MRRSKAPSVLNKAKRTSNLINNIEDTELETDGLQPDDEQYNWGSNNHNGEEKVFTNQHKRIFNIVWRDISNKKHKTWKGDGIIEVNLNTMKAILKDETGRYIGCSKNFNVHDLEADFQMVIGGKEIEIQNEIKDEVGLYGLRKRQKNVCDWKVKKCGTPDKQVEEESKPVLILKQPELPRNCEMKSNSNFHIKPNLTELIQQQMQKSTTNIKRKEFICFIKPSELQQFLFKQVLDYIDCMKNNLSVKSISSLEFKNVLQQICIHPSLLNHKSTTNELVRHLKPYLPEWSEMGPFDSGKLEYLQYFLNASSKVVHQNCIILAKHANTLNMLQGLSDYMHIKCLRLNMDVSEEIKSATLNEFTTASNFMQVLLINSMEVLKNISQTSRCQMLIVFEEVSENIEILETLKKLQGFAVYYLVTAFSIEELLLLNDYGTESCSNNLLQNFCSLSSTDDNVCYVHTKIGCKCFENNYKLTNCNKDNKFLNNWQHFKNPFDDVFLKVCKSEKSILRSNNPEKS